MFKRNPDAFSNWKFETLEFAWDLEPGIRDFDILASRSSTFARNACRRILWCDSITETAATLVARNVNFLRGRICGFARGPDFSQSRPRSKTERNCSPIHRYDNSIIHHQSNFDQAAFRGAEKETHAGAISRDTAVRHRTAVSQRVLGQSSRRNVCRCCQRGAAFHIAR